jgi:hypothetical protein
MHRYRTIVAILQSLDPSYMIHVAVGQENNLQFKRIALDDSNDIIGVSAGIHKKGITVFIIY